VHAFEGRVKGMLEGGMRAFEDGMRACWRGVVCASEGTTRAR
jgi:hypothetical protein